jgi:hypothetical protein
VLGGVGLAGLLIGVLINKKRSNQQSGETDHAGP